MSGTYLQTRFGPAQLPATGWRDVFRSSTASW